MQPSPRVLAGLAPGVQALIREAGSAAQESRSAVARQRYEAALRRLGPGADPSLFSSLIRWIGRTYTREGELEAAEDCMKAAVAVAGAHGDRRGRAHALNCIAILYQKRGALERAVELYEAAREIARSVRETRLVAMIEQNLGTIANIRGRVDDAQRHYQASLHGYRMLGLPDYVPALLNNLAMLRTDQGQYERAEELYDEAQQIAAENADTNVLIAVQVNRVELWIARERYDEAREACDRVYETARRLESTRWLGEICKHYGTIFRETGKTRLAAEHLERAVDLARASEDTLLRAEALRQLAEVYRDESRYRETLLHLERAHRLFSGLRARPDLADVDERIERLESFFLDMVGRWGDSIEAKDRYTRGHCERVADYACALARAAGFEERVLVWFRMGALLHDVGKVVVPSRILNKPAALTDEERQTMMRHVDAGVELLSDLEFPWDIRPMVRHHHEQWCGKGYPDGLVGEAIPRSARILCIADVYDALTTDRSYRSAYEPEVALEIMEGDAGHVFDPDLFALFTRVLERPEVRQPPRPASSVRPPGYARARAPLEPPRG